MNDKFKIFIDHIPGLASTQILFQTLISLSKHLGWGSVIKSFTRSIVY